MDVATRHGSRTATPPLLFGTILFLASELLFFGGLFAAYFTLRAQTTPWPPNGVELDVALSGVATLLLIVSSFTLHAGVSSGSRGARGRMALWVWLTIALGAVFMGIQIYDWLHVPFEISSHAYGTMYFAMTGFHGAHVLAGIVLMLVILGRMRQGAYRSGNLEGPEGISYYWHFVDVVWIALYATIFLLR